MNRTGSTDPKGFPAMKKLEVMVYRNLHQNGVVYSIRAEGKVICHSENIMLKNAKFFVQKAGLQKVRKTKQKNVHAYIKGELVLNPSEISKIYNKLKKTKNQVFYDPYKYDSFVNQDQNVISSASYVYLGSVKGKYWVVFV